MNIDIKVLVNGKEFATHTREDWDRVSRLVYAMLDLSEGLSGSPTDTAPQTVPAHNSVNADSEPARGIELPSTPEITHKLPPSNVANPITRVDPVVEAAKSIGRPATGEEIHRALMARGHRWQAKNPEGSTKRAIRENPTFVRIGVTVDNRTVWSIRDMWHDAEMPYEVLQFNPDKSLTDYAVEALELFRTEVDLDTLGNKMIELGWISTSKDAIRRKHALRQTLSTRGADKIEHTGDGLWGLKEWYSVKPQPSFPTMTETERKDSDLSDVEMRFLEQRRQNT